MTLPDSQHPAPLIGKVALVTGAGSRGDGIGNGRATAVVLARRGATVVMLDSEPGRLEHTVELVAATGSTFRAVTCDVSDPESCSAAVAEAVDAFGGVDILVNNVGVFGPVGDAVNTAADGWAPALAVNVTSMMLMAKYTIPEMVKRGGGSIVNISSVAGMMGGNPNLFYSTTKGAIIAMTRSMASQHGHQGVRVNTVAPGLVLTPMVTVDGMTETVRRQRRKRSLLGTEGTAWDVAAAVAFLAGDDARWITGVVLPVDAGASAGRSVVEHPDLAGA